MDTKRIAQISVKRMSNVLETFLANLRHITPAGGTVTLATSTQHDLYQCVLYLHGQLSSHGVEYYFLGGFACINVGMSARTTSDIDIAVASGQQSLGFLLQILSKVPFFQDKSGTLSPDAYFFHVAASNAFVEVDFVLAGMFAFPKIENAQIVRLGSNLQLSFLSAPELLKLKLNTWSNANRRLGAKRNNDMADIISIRDLMVNSRQKNILRDLRGGAREGLKLWWMSLMIWQYGKNWIRCTDTYKT